MKSFKRLFLIAAVTALMVVSLTPVANAKGGPPETATFATYNASLNRANEGDLIDNLSTSDDVQAQQVAEIIQRTRPEVLLVNEFDYDAGGVALGLFQDNYLSVSQNGAHAIHYPYAYAAPSNTGVDSGVDLDGDGSLGGLGDAYGFGFFPGQFAFVVYSMHPIDLDGIRTFQEFRWADMPGALLPVNEDGSSYYSAEALDVFRLSSKNHVDLPIHVGDEVVHFLVSHPTPPVFDGPEDRNGTRNHDEIRFWADYIHQGRSWYIYDDAGNYGGLHGPDRFVIAGDQNADPFDGDSTGGAIQQLLENPKVNTNGTPGSDGGPEAAALQGGANDDDIGDPTYDTADFGDDPPFGAGNLRVDYVLPRVGMTILSSGVFWPTTDDPLSELVSASDHRLVWIEVTVKQ